MKHSENFDEYEEAMQRGNAERYLFKLYISGITPNSTRALENIKAICECYLPGRYDLQIIDIYQQPSFAVVDQIIAVPTLVKVSPGINKKMVGDLSDIDKVLACLGLKKKNE